MRCWLNLRHLQSDRADHFRRGLARLGYEVRNGLPVKPEGLLVTWNRVGHAETVAKDYEKAGLPVIVAENASWGDLVPGKWLHLARTRHNTAGMFPVGDWNRWDSLDIDLKPWKTTGETVVLAQRGIGSSPTRMPRDWPQRVQGRVRPHPGRVPSRTSLRDDLARCGRVVTWGSAGAVQALAWGIPVESHMPNWLGEQDNTDAGRLAMFRRMAWAQWRMTEISSGEAFRWLINDTQRTVREDVPQAA